MSKASLLVKCGVGAILAWVGVSSGGYGLTASNASAQGITYRPATSVPASWKRYSELVQFRLAEWMAREDETAYRFHLFLQERAAERGKSQNMVALKVWIRSDGSVDRVAFPSLGDPQADGDLRMLLTRENIGEAPPSDMLQPLNLMLALKAKG